MIDEWEIGNLRFSSWGEGSDFECFRKRTKWRTNKNLPRYVLKILDWDTPVTIFYFMWSSKFWWFLFRSFFNGYSDGHDFECFERENQIGKKKKKNPPKHILEFPEGLASAENLSWFFTWGAHQIFDGSISCSF